MSTHNPIPPTRGTIWWGHGRVVVYPEDCNNISPIDIDEARTVKIFYRSDERVIIRSSSVNEVKCNHSPSVVRSRTHPTSIKETRRAQKRSRHR